MAEAVQSLYRGLHPSRVPRYSLRDISKIANLPYSGWHLTPHYFHRNWIRESDGNLLLPKDDNIIFLPFTELVRYFVQGAEQGELGDKYRALVEARKNRVQSDPDGEPVRLYPFLRRDSRDESPRLIAVDSQKHFGRPYLVSCGIRTDAIYGRFRAGETVAELAEDCELSTSDIEEAIRFESRPTT